jgi:glycosyltransferase involved in cell wall biosynthesis
VTILRPVIAEPAGNRPSLSIIIPARNERGNIAQALSRLPDFGGAQVEVIFVEGHSTDGTWEEIERVVAMYAQTEVPHPGPLPEGEGVQRRRVRALRQTGRGKGDAVRLGFAAATCDLLTILDADLTMPPEALQEFYEAYREGRGDFINGDRLSMPMEHGAMRPLNKLGNRFFAWALSHVLETPLGDCLCGTKLFARHDWQRFAAWRDDFGDRDPFGDFDLLFPAAVLALGCVNVPIHYAARTYGTTNIHRFRDGARLLAMTLAGWWRIKVPRGRGASTPHRM